MTIEELKRAALDLPPNERAELSDWLIERRGSAWAPEEGQGRAGDVVADGEDADLATFEADMASFAQGTEGLTPYTGTYARDDIYLDHD
jgi:hypothetical protein